MISKLHEIIKQQISTIEENHNITEFKLPINYIEDKYPLQECIKSDLELLPNENQITLYNNLFNPVSDYANKIMPMWSEYYTTDKQFLHDTQ